MLLLCVCVMCVREPAFKYVCGGQKTRFRGQLPRYMLKTQDKVTSRETDLTPSDSSCEFHN